MLYQLQNLLVKKLEGLWLILSAIAKFLDQQKLLNKNKETPKKLIQDVSTRWHSTYYMLQRFVEVEESIRTTMASIDEDLPIVTSEEWDFIKELLDVLQPLENATNIMSGENYLTASSVIILTDGLLNIYTDLQKRNYKDVTKNCINNIIESINRRLGDLERSNSLLFVTFLDPRFKNIGFSSEAVMKKAKKNVISLVVNYIESNFRTELPEDGNTINLEKPDENKISLWSKFEKKVAAFQPVGSAHSKAIKKMQRFLEESPIPRTTNLLIWWKENACNFPYLSKIFKEKCVSVATSVPCERLFSKSGQIISDQKNTT
nr:PREDICTED: zinc finger BED domain-containing protein 4 [Tribolium castaneum]|eukprot:XP_015837581.1 PREDICTED: zinc finger BED domain-containing protein 4 [Tribolium castaneum]